MSNTLTFRDTAKKSNDDPIEEGRWGRYYDPVAPQSPVLQKIVSESCSVRLYPAALLLQIANKPVGLGVAAHSDFTKRPVERARRTILYIYGMVFGDKKERQFISDLTHRIHSRIKGPNCGANDVDLQLWVASTIYWSLITAYEEVFDKLDDETAEQAYKEFSVMATGLRVPPEKWPKDLKAFQEYCDNTVASLEITEEAKAITQDVMYPAKHLPWAPWLYAMASGPSTRIFVTESLPERIRNEYGMPSTPYTRSMHMMSKTTNRAVYPLLPESVRHFPKSYTMQDFRTRIEKGSSM
jgi:uncharacterized protein (DUF2236 family)